MTRRAFATADLAALLMTEEDLLAGILELPQRRDYYAYHTRDSRKSERGFPDLILAGIPGTRAAGTVFAIELKRVGQRPRPDQLAWLAALDGATMTSGIWTPINYHAGEIDRTLAPSSVDH